VNNQTALSSHRPQVRKGFTLIELAVTVAVVAIVAAIALPSFLDSIRKSRRADAFTAITTIQQAQERWRGNQALYATNAQLTLGVTAIPPGLGLTAATARGYYTLEVPGVTASASEYTVEATAVAGKSQDADGDCKVLGARVRGGNVTYGSGATAVNFDATNPDPGRCWAR
jgi:type IV pilus assembly protein PilE